MRKLPVRSLVGAAECRRSPKRMRGFSSDSGWPLIEAFASATTLECACERRKSTMRWHATKCDDEITGEEAAVVIVVQERCGNGQRLLLHLLATLAQRSQPVLAVGWRWD